MQEKKDQKIKLSIPKEKAFYTYLLLFVAVVLYHAFSLFFLQYLTPLFLFTVPYFLQHRVTINFKPKDILLGIAASVVFLFPFFFYMIVSNKAYYIPSLSVIFFQLFAVSLPEEFYFRGFLQEIFGNNVRGMVFVSILFSILHLPQLLFYGEIFSVLTFFPSLVMGYLYMKTSNVLPSTLFHFFANIVYFGI